MAALPPQPVARVVPRLLRQDGGTLLLADPPDRARHNRWAAGAVRHAWQRQRPWRLLHVLLLAQQQAPARLLGDARCNQNCSGERPQCIILLPPSHCLAGSAFWTS